MDLDAFTERAVELLGQLREALAVVEEAAQSDPDPGWLELSRGYALLVSPLRDYVAGVEAGRPLPRQLARRLAEKRADLVAHGERIALLDLHPNLAELDAFRRDAESAA